MSTSSEPTRRKWRGVDPDARVEARRRRLIDAAVQVLAAEGLGGTTVRAVCARSGLHSRYFYENFEDIDALLVAVFDQLSSEFLREVAAAADAAPQDPRSRLQAAMRASAAIVARDGHLVRILAVEAIGNEKLNRRRIQLLHDIADMIEQDAYSIYGTPGPGELIGALSARFLAGGMAELLVAWVNGELAGDTQAMADDAVELILAVSDRSRTLAASRARTAPARARGRNSA